MHFPRGLVVQPQGIETVIPEVPHADHHRLLPGLPGHLLPGRGRPRPLGPAVHRGQPRSSLHRRVLPRQARSPGTARLSESQPYHRTAAA
ncbi:MAG: hypothetical protein MZU95_10745 [Desulfomicrobium escambiense]|nr:hypothetical protein [Desulfomicrobium escambiense]